jgi:hypothetical protein
MGAGRMFLGLAASAAILASLLFFLEGDGRGWYLLVPGLIYTFIEFNIRCPRCGSHHSVNRGGWYHSPWDAEKPDCQVCGRTKRGVWPFQRLLAPERRP